MSRSIDHFLHNIYHYSSHIQCITCLHTPQHMWNYTLLYLKFNIIYLQANSIFEAPHDVNTVCTISPVPLINQYISGSFTFSILWAGLAGNCIRVERIGSSSACYASVVLLYFPNVAYSEANLNL